MDLYGSEGGEELGEMKGGKLITIYYVRKEPYYVRKEPTFNKRKSWIVLCCHTNVKKVS